MAFSLMSYLKQTVLGIVTIVAPVKRVTHVISSLSHGGAEKLAMDLALVQTQLGMQISIAYLNSAINIGNDQETEEKFQKFLHSAGIRTVALDQKSGLGYWLSRVVALRKFLSDEKPEIIHAHLGRVLMLMLLGFVRVPSVMTIHSVHVGFPGVLFKAFRFLNVRYVAVGNAIACLYEPKVGSRISVIPNGIDLQKFSDNQLDARINTDKLQVVAVGRVLPPKNYPLLLEAAEILRLHPVSELHPWQLRVAGDGPLLPEMQELVSNSQLQNFVNFIGGCDDIPSFLSSADVFVMSSDYEGMPMAMIEAMAAGLPIACTNFDGVSDLVENEDSALFSEIGDAHGLASNLARLLSSESLRLSLGESAAERAKQFSIEASNHTYLEIYDEMSKSSSQ